MITLEVADLVVIASRTLGLDTGEVLGLLDTAAAGQALAHAQAGSEPGDPASLAAAAPTRHRPLPSRQRLPHLARVSQPVMIAAAAP